MTDRAIKSVSLQQIEAAVSKALGDLTGTPYAVEIHKLELLPDPLNGFGGEMDSSRLEMTLSLPRDPTESLFPPDERT